MDYFWALSTLDPRHSEWEPVGGEKRIIDRHLRWILKNCPRIDCLRCIFESLDHLQQSSLISRKIKETSYRSTCPTITLRTNAYNRTILGSRCPDHADPFIIKPLDVGEIVITKMKKPYQHLKVDDILIQRTCCCFRNAFF